MDIGGDGAMAAGDEAGAAGGGGGEGAAAGGEGADSDVEMEMDPPPISKGQSRAQQWRRQLPEEEAAAARQRNTEARRQRRAAQTEEEAEAARRREAENQRRRRAAQTEEEAKAARDRNSEDKWRASESVESVAVEIAAEEKRQASPEFKRQAGTCLREFLLCFSSAAISCARDRLDVHGAAWRPTGAAADDGGRQKLPQ